MAIETPAYWKAVELVDTYGFPYVLLLLSEIATVVGADSLTEQLEAVQKHAKKIYENPKKPLDSRSTIG